MHPVTTSTVHSHHHPPPLHSRILHAPAPHLRSQIPAIAKVHELNGRRRPLPSGSKSTSKAPNSSIGNTVNSFNFHLLEISDGCDVANSVAAFVAGRQRGLCILSGSGAVADVTIRQPGYSDTVVTLQGRFEILSISGSFLSSPSPAAAAGIAVYLAAGNGEVVGGSVVGELRASGKVVLTALSFLNEVYERLPLDGEKTATDG